jgi:Zn finger protein HypA/HybF involved in hydrogenase expression
MHKAVKILITLIAVGLMFLGLIFIMAAYGPDQNFITGLAMVLVGIGLFVFLYLDSRLEARRPTVVQQTYNIKMGGSGEFKEKRISCRACSAPLEDKDLKLIDGGIMYKCPYCGSSGAIEEEPKW